MGGGGVLGRSEITGKHLWKTVQGEDGYLKLENSLCSSGTSKLNYTIR